MATVLVDRFVRFDVMLMALLGGFAKCHKSVLRYCNTTYFVTSNKLQGNVTCRNATH